MRQPHFRFRPFFWLRRDPTALEVWSAMCAVYWALVLILPFETFNWSRSYATLAQVATEHTWAFWMSLVGALQSVSLCGNQKWLRYPSALLSMITWFFCAGLFLSAAPYSHAPGIYGLLALGQLWVIIRGPD